MSAPSPFSAGCHARSSMTTRPWRWRGSWATARVGARRPSPKPYQANRTTWGSSTKMFSLAEVKGMATGRVQGPCRHGEDGTRNVNASSWFLIAGRVHERLGEVLNARPMAEMPSAIAARSRWTARLTGLPALFGDPVSDALREYVKGDSHRAACDAKTGGPDRRRSVPECPLPCWSDYSAPTSARQSTRRSSPCKLPGSHLDRSPDRPWRRIRERRRA